MVDVYQGYKKVNEAKRCCFAYIRRYLLEAIPKGHEKDYRHPAVQEVLYCNKLFEYERVYKEKGLSCKQIGNRRLKTRDQSLSASWRGQTKSLPEILPNLRKRSHISKTTWTFLWPIWKAADVA